jgi:hypothetical protein
VNKHAACGATAWLQTELLVSGSKQWYLCWYYVWLVKWICVRLHLFVADCTAGGWHNLLFCMGVKLGRWHWRRNVGWRCLKIGCWGECLGLRGTR